MILRFAIAVLCACLSSACSLSVKPKQFAGVPGQPYVCLRYAVPIDIAAPANGLLGDPFLDRVAAAASEARSVAAGEPISNSMLFLSGGSQHGAFGAGFLNRWSERRAGLPRFRVVTGISTGALQSTLAFIGESREIVNRYAVLSESELLTPNTRAHLDGGNVEAARAAIVIAKKGAIAELVPLRGQLLGEGPHDPSAVLSAARLAKVAAEAGEGRKLFVGAVELDSAKAVAFDLTSIAEAYLKEQDAGARETLRRCYAEALVASSSVPIAAQPSFIEGKMFIDGGARFGVLPAKLFELTRHLAERGIIGAREKPNLFIIVNGTLETDVKCDLKKCEKDAVAQPFPPTGRSRAHSDWSFPELAFRSLSVLINQSYVTSVELARRDAEWCRRESIASGVGDTCAADHASDGMTVHFVRILSGDLASKDFRFAVNGLRQPVESDAPYEAASRTCDEWSEEDDKLEPHKPHEFHPRYMRCLIRYGAGVADSVRWWEDEPRTAAAPSGRTE